MPQKRVLIVDDDAHLRNALQLWFAQANFETILATNGDEALRALDESGSVDLVLSDFMMPERNGIELVRSIKGNEKLRGLPVVLMSNNADPEFRERALALGACAFLLKTEGAREVAEKAIRMILGLDHANPAGRAPTASNAQVQAMQQSLLTLIRFAAEAEGLSAQAKSALLSAEKLAQSLFLPM